MTYITHGDVLAGLDYGAHAQCCTILQPRPLFRLTLRLEKGPGQVSSVIWCCILRILYCAIGFGGLQRSIMSLSTI